jgi:hypothetical protein
MSTGLERDWPALTHQLYNQQALDDGLEREVGIATHQLQKPPRASMVSKLKGARSITIYLLQNQWHVCSVGLERH